MNPSIGFFFSSIIFFLVFALLKEGVSGLVKATLILIIIFVFVIIFSTTLKIYHTYFQGLRYDFGLFIALIITLLGQVYFHLSPYKLAAFSGLLTFNGIFIIHFADCQFLGVDKSLKNTMLKGITVGITSSTCSLIIYQFIPAYQLILDYFNIK